MWQLSVLSVQIKHLFIVLFRYVLLKERNMLLTLKYEANRQGFIMPAPERLKKVTIQFACTNGMFNILLCFQVRQSMARIKLVIGERVSPV